MELYVRVRFKVEPVAEASNTKSVSGPTKLPFATFTGSAVYPLVGTAPTKDNSGISKLSRSAVTPSSCR